VANQDNVIRTFGADQVQRITGLTRAQLNYWDETGFFQTEFAKDGRGDGYERVYSFKDVVSLRTLSVLRGTYKVSLPHLREVAEKLADYSQSPWAELKLLVVKRKVVFVDPRHGHAVGVTDGQYAMLPIIDVIEHVERASGALGKRGDTQIGKFEKHRNIAHNTLVISGTRVPVKSVLAFIQNGFSIERVLQEYPRLTKDDVLAVIRNADSSKAA
jgi:uncharacterized protein (DUF433 family)